MKSYFTKPARDDKPARLLCLAGIFGSVLTFYLSSLLPLFKAAGQLVSVLLLLGVVWISTRFLLTDYRYRYEDGVLHLSSRQGKREKHLGSLPLPEGLRIFTKAQWQENKKEYKIKNRFSYCQNLFPKHPYYLLCPEEESYLLLILEPDETLLGLLKEKSL